MACTSGSQQRASRFTETRIRILLMVSGMQGGYHESVKIANDTTIQPARADLVCPACSEKLAIAWHWDVEFRPPIRVLVRRLKRQTFNLWFSRSEGV